MVKQMYKVGDLVRVPATAILGERAGWHPYKPGQVVEVVSVTSWCYTTERITVRGGVGSVVLDRSVTFSGLKLAKQAMKKRDLYGERRG